MSFTTNELVYLARDGEEILSFIHMINVQTHANTLIFNLILTSEQRHG